jgi:hypothetical protein
MEGDMDFEMKRTIKLEDFQKMRETAQEGGVSINQMFDTFINDAFGRITESEINYIDVSEKRKREGNVWMDMVMDDYFIIKFLKNEYSLNRFLYTSNSKLKKNEPGIRKLELYEDFSNRKKIFMKNSDLYSIGEKNGISEEEIFFIIVFRNNYNILKKYFNTEIPEAKFAIVKTDFFQKPKFSIIQKSVDGTSLWDLYYGARGEFIKKHSFIKEKLKKYLKNKYIDLNIKNFIITSDITGKGSSIYYVDNKPTYLSSKKTNDQTRSQLKKYLLKLVYN